MNEDLQWIKNNLGDTFGLEKKLVVDKLGVFRHKMCIVEWFPSSNGGLTSRVIVELNWPTLSEKDKEDIIAYRDKVLKTKWGKTHHNFLDIHDSWIKDIKTRKSTHTERIRGEVAVIKDSSGERVA